MKNVTEVFEFSNKCSECLPLTSDVLILLLKLLLLLYMFKQMQHFSCPLSEDEKRHTVDDGDNMNPTILLH